MKSKWTGWLGAVCALTAFATAAHADSYPSKPIKILVGFAPGGAPDVVARSLGERMSQILKQPVIIDNKPGAGGTIATAVAAKSPADGYTLVIGDVGQLAIAPYLFKVLAYDPIKDLTPISMIASVPLVLASNANTAAIKSMDDLVRRAKATPGKLSYASSGIGSVHHLAMEMFKYEAGIDITHVPYKGSGQSVPALVSGEVELAMTSLPTLGPFLPGGKVNLLAVTSKKRIPNASETPTVAEAYKGFDYAAELGILAPAGVPPEVVSKLANAVKMALASPEVQTRLNGQGAIPDYLAPEDYAENLRQNLKKYKKAVEVSKLTPN